jgi:branched-chain amino acid transport system permease protein
MKPRTVLRGSLECRVYQVAGWALLVLGVLWVIGPEKDYQVLRYAQGVCFGLAILGLNLVTGYSGQISLGHSAFFGIGAYTSLTLVADHGWPFLATLPVAGLIGLAVGCLVGLPALRIRGLYLALVTLGLAIAFPSFVKKFDSITCGPNGKNFKTANCDLSKATGWDWTPPSWVPSSVTRDEWVFLTIVVVSVAMALMASNMMRSRYGRAVEALRDSEIGAAASGVNLALYKVTAFGVSALYASVAGGLYALAAGGVADTSFQATRSVEFIAGLVIGGVATIIGPFVGGMVVEWVPHWAFNIFPGPEAGVLFGLILVVLVFVMPGGILQAVRMVRAKFVRIVPNLPRPTSQSAPPPGGSTEREEQPTNA